MKCYFNTKIQMAVAKTRFVSVKRAHKRSFVCFEVRSMYVQSTSLFGTGKICTLLFIKVYARCSRSFLSSPVCRTITTSQYISFVPVHFPLVRRMESLRKFRVLKLIAELEAYSHNIPARPHMQRVSSFCKHISEIKNCVSTLHNLGAKDLAHDEPRVFCLVHSR